MNCIPSICILFYLITYLIPYAHGSKQDGNKDMIAEENVYTDENKTMEEANAQISDVKIINWSFLDMPKDVNKITLLPIGIDYPKAILIRDGILWISRYPNNKDNSSTATFTKVDLDLEKHIAYKPLKLIKFNADDSMIHKNHDEYEAKVDYNILGAYKHINNRTTLLDKKLIHKYITGDFHKMTISNASKRIFGINHDGVICYKDISVAMTKDWTPIKNVFAYDIAAYDDTVYIIGKDGKLQILKNEKKKYITEDIKLDIPIIAISVYKTLIYFITGDYQLRYYDPLNGRLVPILSYVRKISVNMMGIWGISAQTGTLFFIPGHPTTHIGVASLVDTGINNIYRLFPAPDIPNFVGVLDTKVLVMGVKMNTNE